MQTIHKFEAYVIDDQKILMPAGAKIVHAAFQNNLQTRIWLWAEVDTTRPLVQRNLLIVGTGNPLPGNANRHIATLAGNPFVWHLYEG